MTATIDAVRKSVLVQAPPEHAFHVFTEGMSRWWPIETHHLQEKPADAVVVEAAYGGRWYERDADGNECDWGRVLVWEPPSRVVFTWEIDAEWRPNPACRSEIEVTFTPEGDRTRVALEHRNLEAYGDRAGEIATRLASEGGWNGLLESFATAAAS